MRIVCAVQIQVPNFTVRPPYLKSAPVVPAVVRRSIGYVDKYSSSCPTYPLESLALAPRNVFASPDFEYAVNVHKALIRSLSLVSQLVLWCRS